MNSRRTVILIVAILLGALSALGLSRYVSGLEAEANAGQELNPVWVVVAPIPKGTPIEQVINQGLIAQEQVPVTYIPSSAIKDPGAELDGLVAVVDLPVRSFVVQGNFVAPNIVQTGITDRLEENGMHTVTFQVDQLRGVANFVRPGDFVNILSIRPIAFPGEAEEGAEGEGGEEAEIGAIYEALNIPRSAEDSLYQNSVRYVYQKAEILSIGTTLTSDLGDATAEGAAAAAAPVAGGLITLAVPPEAVQLVLSIMPDEIYLSLVPPTYQPVEILPLDTGDIIFPAEDDTRLTPYGPEGAVNDPSRDADEEEVAPAGVTPAPSEDDTSAEADSDAEADDQG